MAVTVALLEERSAVRIGIQNVLSPHFDVRVLDVPDGEALDHTVLPAPGTDVVFVGQVHQGQSLNCLRWLSRFSRQQGFRILLFWEVANHSQITQLLAAGAYGYVCPSSDSQQLVSAVTIVANHGYVFLPAPAYPVPRGSATEIPPDTAGLTEREYMVLSSLGHGLSNAEIAKNLSISEATVKKHLSQVMQKIQQPDRLRAGLYAYRHGLF